MRVKQGTEYTAAEVGWLLSMSRQQALECDLPAAATFGGESAGESVPVLTIVRWADVQRAKGQVHVSRAEEDLVNATLEAERAAQLAAEGYSQREIAERLEMSQASVSRRATTFVDAVLDELGCSVK